MNRVRCTVSTSIGALTLEAEDGAVVRVDLRSVTGVPREPAEPVLRHAVAQIREYLEGGRAEFDVPLRRGAGTSPFQHRVWDALAAIPYGETLTYGELAAKLGTSARAVGGACRRNPLPILVPCHRVVAKHGLGGYSGDWQTGLAVDLKQTLLQRETSAP